MSKRNFSTITCLLSQSDLVKLVEEYGISLCYDPKLPSSNATALDAPKGYIPLYMSLFFIGNLRFPLNNFCLDVFEFFRCHFTLLNPFGVARVTTFVVAWEATIPLFRSLLTLGLAGDWLTFQKRPGYGIPAIFGDSMSNIPKWKSEFIFFKQTLIFDIRPGLIIDFRHGQGSFPYPYPTEPFDEVLRGRLCRHHFEAQTFPEPILYLVGLTNSWEHAPSIPSILIDGEEVEESHAAHNMISGLHYLLLKDKLGFLTFDELVDIYDIHAFQMAVKSLLEHEMSKLEGQLAKAQKNQDVEGESRKKLEEEVDGLQSRLKETERLGQRCQDLEHERDFLLKKSKEVSVLASQLEAAKLEKFKLVKDFLLLADYHPEVEKIFYEATEAFYKLEFPYISLLVENAGLSSEELDSLEAPSAQEAPLP
ncbi:hypothetical protein Tco_0907918 [Tanacetum coccineum]|uniref:FRIGIDA-like protein n=1 Tax=Tanacetum coccineum TaxID=301880 RepID=A0ABQ5CNX8_9ASTR